MAGQWTTTDPAPADTFANPLVSGDNAAPFGDGIPNLLRYALGAAPGDAVQLPEFAKSAATATFRFRYDPALFDLVYQVETTGDLADWSTPPPRRGSPRPAAGWKSPIPPRRPAAVSNGCGFPADSPVRRDHVLAKRSGPRQAARRKG